MEPYLRHTRFADGKRITVYAHIEVWIKAHGPIPQGMQVDHVNGDKRDNRLENLRLVTKSQNGMNRGPNKNNTTGLKGLTWVSARGKWLCQVSARGIRKTHRAECLLDAAAWLIRERSIMHGEYAYERRD